MIDFLMKSKLIISMFLTVKLSSLISLFQKRGFHEIVSFIFLLVVVVVLLLYVQGKHLRSCRDGQLT